MGAGAGVQEEGRAIGVRNNDGRAEVAAEALVGRTAARKKTRGWLLQPLMAGAGLRGSTPARSRGLVG